tara:strand:- start:19229 stop:19465 length:237 start_codon:yes stop_codon:yes gene_type:complete
MLTHIIVKIRKNKKGNEINLSTIINYYYILHPINVILLLTMYKSSNSDHTTFDLVNRLNWGFGKKWISGAKQYTIGGK